MGLGKAVHQHLGTTCKTVVKGLSCCPEELACEDFLQSIWTPMRSLLSLGFLPLGLGEST